MTGTYKLNLKLPCTTWGYRWAACPSCTCIPTPSSPHWKLSSESDSDGHSWKLSSKLDSDGHRIKLLSDCHRWKVLSESDYDKDHILMVTTHNC